MRPVKKFTKYVAVVVAVTFGLTLTNAFHFLTTNGPPPFAATGDLSTSQWIWPSQVTTGQLTCTPVWPPPSYTVSMHRPRSPRTLRGQANEADAWKEYRDTTGDLEPAFGVKGRPMLKTIRA